MPQPTTLRSQLVRHAAALAFASLGIAAMDATTISGQHLIQRADEAMYVAKRSGKDRIMTHRDLVTRVKAECGKCPQ